MLSRIPIPSRQLVCVTLLVLSASAYGKRAPPALQNLGNTCYLNAQIQCAYHIPQVRNIVLQSGHDDDNKEQPSITAAHTALRDLFRDMSTSTTTTSPRAFCQALGIPIWQQQDSQEFWKLLLPAVQSPALSDLYQGAYQDYIVALDGSQRERRKEEAFLDLSLDVQPTLEEVLTQLVQPELLKATEGNGWRPEKGAPAIDAQKGIQLQSASLPPILQLHLKRFHFDWNTETTTKINAPCVFPVVLNLGQFCGTDEKDDVLYDLQGIVVHVGEYGEGHYYAYVRPDIQSNAWYRCNDDVIESVDLKHALCDSYGGQQQPSLIQQRLLQSEQDESSSLDVGSEVEISTPKQDDSKKVTEKGFWRRLIGNLFGSSSENYAKDDDASPTFGFGGPTSSAYVLQYVRRSAVPRLYGIVDRDETS
jgi:ubiquitin carboxyl-terminal hydrolase 7